MMDTLWITETAKVRWNEGVGGC